ncbi:MAG: response regulator, partial [Thiomargarita sp.]|nr:response regulator [Thiomargarita sp.]
DNKPGNLTEKQIEYAKTMNSAGKDLLTLINDILDLSKVEAGKVEIQWENVLLLDLFTIIEQKFKPIAENKQLEFTINIDDSINSTLRTDGQRLKQIINNLLSNAFKFTSQGSIKIVIQYPTEVPTNIGGQQLELNKTIAIRVIDSGIGIPQDKQQAIFEAFQQVDGSTSRKYGGTGLGLSISRQLARLLGGEITLTSDDKGSIFTLYLPKSVEANKSVEEPILIKKTLTKSKPVTTLKPIPDDRDNLQADDKSILIVEDDRKFSKILMELSAENNFKCLLAEDGSTGVQLAKQYKPSAIILDIGLPKLNGWSVMEQLKDNSETRHIPVHFMSATDQSIDAKKMGAIGYLLKPVSMNKLTKAFKQIEHFLTRTVKNLLIVTDIELHKQKIIELVGEADIKIHQEVTVKSAFQNLQTISYDCIILDIEIENSSGSKLLEMMQQINETYCQTPIIVYADRDLTTEEETLLMRCSDEIPIKSVSSSERLLDETTLFLHQIEAKLPDNKRNMLHMIHDKEAILKNKKILIADDDVRNAFALTTVLENYDMSVIIAENGNECLEKLEQNSDINMVLMDIMMPEMDGYEAIQAIRQQPKYKKLPIIALTAKAMKDDKAKCIEAGANDYLAKPVDADKLLSLMRVWLYR